MRSRIIATAACAASLMGHPGETTAQPASGWHGIPWGSSPDDVRQAFPLLPRPTAPSTDRISGPPCYSSDDLRPASFVLPSSYRLDGVAFGVTFCFYGNRLGGVNMLGVVNTGSAVVATLPDELTRKYGPAEFDGGYLDTPGKELHRWATPQSVISLLTTSVMVRNVPVKSLLLVYISSDFIRMNKRRAARSLDNVP